MIKYNSYHTVKLVDLGINRKVIGGGQSGSSEKSKHLSRIKRKWDVDAGLQFYGSFYW